MSLKTLCLFLLLVVFADCKNLKHRVPRFVGTYTSYVTSTQLVTSIVPSSCVSIDPTLQPCRSVRFLSFPNLAPWGNFFNRTVQAKSMETETTTLGWGEYFGFYAPTVTVTQLELQTTFVKDPRIVVTYAVKGCRPQKIPGDLDSCEIPQTLPIQTVIPTSTVTALHSTAVTNNSTNDLTNLQNKRNSSNKNAITDESVKDEMKNHPGVESSTEDFIKEDTNTKSPTQPLPF